MTRPQPIAILVFCLVLGWGRPAAAQVIPPLVPPLPVIDVANLAQNIAQWVQLVLTVANQVLELTPVDEVILNETFSATVDEVITIIASAVGLSYDIQSLNAQVTVLFDLSTAPTSMTELRVRLHQTKRVAYECHVYALRTQTLMQSTVHALTHLQNLVRAIGSFIGNMQGNQTVAQLQGNLTEVLARLQVQTATFDRSQSVEHITDLMTLESLRLIHGSIMADHPRR